jgi:pSer/pThr/pTyr-binding forkhead associated (FHA) protein
METNSNNKQEMGVAKATDVLSQGAQLAAPEVVYRRVPSDGTEGGAASGPIWRLRLELAYDPTVCLGLDVCGEAVLGRGKAGPDFVALTDYDAATLGVSRRHAMLRPTSTKLYVIDLGSTNGTWINGRSIGVNMPYSLTNGDLLKLGELEFVARIVNRPRGHTAALRDSEEMASTLAEIARGITSQLDLSEVIARALDVSMSLVPAKEASLWLVDKQTGELFLEATQKSEDSEVDFTRLPISDSRVAKVIETGEPVRAQRPATGELAGGHDGGRMENILYLPLSLADVPFGVLMATITCRAAPSARVTSICCKRSRVSLP